MFEHSQQIELHKNRKRAWKTEQGNVFSCVPLCLSHLGIWQDVALRKFKTGAMKCDVVNYTTLTGAKPRLQLLPRQAYIFGCFFLYRSSNSLTKRQKERPANKLVGR